jgi:hypothetical protein
MWVRKQYMNNFEKVTTKIVKKYNRGKGKITHCFSGYSYKFLCINN